MEPVPERVSLRRSLSTKERIKAEAPFSLPTYNSQVPTMPGTALATWDANQNTDPCPRRPYIIRSEKHTTRKKHNRLHTKKDSPTPTSQRHREVEQYVQSQP